MKTLFTLISFLVFTFPTIANDKVLHGQNAQLTFDSRSISWNYIDDNKLQMTMGGTGGSLYRITVDNTHFNEPLAGTQISFTVLSIGARVLPDFSGMPQFEIWGSIGGGGFGCGVMRFVDGRYRTISSATYSTIKPDNYDPSIPVAFLPADLKTPLYQLTSSKN